MEGTTDNRSKLPRPLVPDRTQVLFVGLGTMGLPMASNLVRAGFAVTGVDVNPASVEAFALAGGRKGHGLHGSAGGCDVVVTMLPDDRAVSDVLGHLDGLIASLRPGTLIIEMRPPRRAPSRRWPRRRARAASTSSNARSARRSSMRWPARSR